MGDDLWPDPAWSKPLPAPLRLVGYSRGLPLADLIAPFEFKDWDRLLRRVSPAIRMSILFGYGDDSFEQRISHPLLNRVDKLSIVAPLIPARAVEFLAKSPLVHRLSTLHVGDVDEDGERLFAELIQPHIPNAFTGRGFRVQGQVFSKEAAKVFMDMRGIPFDPK